MVIADRVSELENKMKLLEDHNRQLSEIIISFINSRDIPKGVEREWRKLEKQIQIVDDLVKDEKTDEGLRTLKKN